MGIAHGLGCTATTTISRDGRHAGSIEHVALGSAPTTTKPEEQTDTRPVEGDGSHDRFSHYVRKSDSTRAYVEGTAIRALCGKVWVPSRDPKRYPVCPTCEEIRKRLVNRGSN